MNKWPLMFIFIMILFASCQKNEVDKPSYDFEVENVEKMSEDIHLPQDNISDTVSEKRISQEETVPNQENQKKTTVSKHPSEKELHKNDEKYVRQESEGVPPYDGTLFVHPDIITETDPSAFKSLESIGKGIRTMYDRRVEDWIEVDAFLFLAEYSDGYTIEIQVNPEFANEESAKVQAMRFVGPIGQLPTSLRTELKTVWIHKGLNLFGGGNNNILIYTEQADEYIREGILEEALMHEATHTSLDSILASDADWIKAQEYDGNFISTYGRDNPAREDLAESFLLYFAVTYRANRIPNDIQNTVKQTIPNRIIFLNKQNFNLYPIE